MQLGAIFYLNYTHNTTVMDYFYLELLPTKISGYFALCDIAIISNLVAIVILLIAFMIKPTPFNGVNFINSIVLVTAVNFSDNVGIFSIFMIVFCLNGATLLMHNSS